MLWSLGVGYVISGMYFGWNLGLPEGGPFGMLIATLLVTLMYSTFVMSYAELSCMMPKAGGAFVYANHALGPKLGFLAGMAQCVEFVFAPPAIAAAIGAYFNIFFPQVSPLAIAMVAYALFTGLNIFGVKHSAIFEVVITVLAVVELLIFAGVTGPHFSWAAFSSNPLPKGWSGILPAIPYAIWFYLAIEGVANTAEETKNPQKDLARGFGSSMITLVFLAILTFFSAVGVKGWEAIVYPAGSTTPSDSPLPLALAHVVGQDHFYYHLLITIGLCGLLASFHGIILVAGRATFEFGRVGYAPAILGKILPRRKTPAAALILNMFIGFAALLTGHTGEIITISVLGALTMYVLSLLSLFRLRKKAPLQHRPFKTPFYPWTPAIALVLALVCLFSMIYTNKILTLIYLALIAGGYGWYFLAIPDKIKGDMRQAAEFT
jgi:ethanolamine permease